MVSDADDPAGAVEPEEDEDEEAMPKEPPLVATLAISLSKFRTRAALRPQFAGEARCR